MTVGEFYLLFITGKLVYTGHMFGYAVMAVAVCGLMVSFDMMRKDFILKGGTIAKAVYALYSPMYTLLFLLVLIKSAKNLDVYVQFSGIIVYFACLIIGIIVASIQTMWEVKYACN